MAKDTFRDEINCVSFEQQEYNKEILQHIYRKVSKNVSENRKK